MSLAPGVRLGAYEILGLLGAGGMGEVYRARDTRLDRDVAIKVLPEAVAADPDRLMRFTREAKMLAALNHPHIAHIHGLEHAGGVHALVMELIDGEDLAARIGRGPVAVDEALAIARQTAEALEAAHEAGIIHRDLKPANIKVRPDGTVKVLDFGLAKALDPGMASSPDAAHSPTFTSPALTELGVILGTAAYMSPEQARGKAVDRRADVWAFGVVLFELLTGRRLFGGETVSDTLAAILREDIPWDALPPETPRAVRRVLRRCLERDARKRQRDIGDARLELEMLADGEPGEEATTGGRPAARGRRPALFGLIGAAGIGALAVLAVLALTGAPATSSAPAPTVRFRLDLPREAASLAEVQIAPDGRAIAFGGGSTLWVRPLDRLEPRRIDLPWPGQLWAWTPDLSSLVVLRREGAANELWRVPLDGSAPQPIGALPAGGFLWGVSPAGRDELVFGMADAGLFTIAASGGAAGQLLAPGDDESLGAPVWLPGRRALLFGEIKRARIEALVDGVRRVVLEREGERFFDPLYAPPGYLLVRLSGGRSADGIWAFPFSPDRLEVTGEPKQLSPYGRASVASDGTLVVREWLSGATPTRLVELDRDGRVVRTVGEPLEGMQSPALSPDGSRIAVSALGAETFHDVFVIERGTGARYRLRDGLGSDYEPFWREGGKELGFVTYNAGIRHARARGVDGRDDARPLNERTVAAAESPDGRYLVTTFYDTTYRERGSDEPRPLFAGQASDLSFSPDGRWLAYTVSDQAGVFLRRVPSGEGLTPVTSTPAVRPRFGRNGREICFWRGEFLVSVPLDLTGETPTIGEPHVLFDASAAQIETGRGFDITPEGTFLMVQRVGGDPAAATTANGIIVIENWTSELSSSPAAARNGGSPAAR